jgi:hypothetical protein
MKFIHSVLAELYVTDIRSVTMDCGYTSDAHVPDLYSYWRGQVLLLMLFMFMG